jgi:hypothetical protein
MAGATTRWGRTGARTSHGKPRSGSESQTGGSMTTAGADVDMRESYSSYLERSASEDMTDALPDIDLYDHDNPLCVTQYVNDIYQYWYKVEVRFATSRRKYPLKTRCGRGARTMDYKGVDSFDDDGTTRLTMNTKRFDCFRDVFTAGDASF